MRSFRKLLAGTTGIIVSVIFTLVGLLGPILLPSSVYAAGQFSARKLTLSSSSPGNITTDANGTTVAAGTGGNGAQAAHTFNFTIGTATSVGSLVIQYCTTPLLSTACVIPAGLDSSTVASIATQTGFSTNNFALDTTTVANTGTFFGTVPCSGSSPYRTNCILIKRTTAAAETATAITLSFGTSGSNWIKNPTGTGTFYARISSFSDVSYTTSVDAAAVAAAINTDIDITAKVQEKLNFSVSAVATTAGGTACTALNGTTSLKLGDPSNGVLDIATAYDAHSYFRLNTNASGGTNVLYSGDTLKTSSGASIAATTPASTAKQSVPGTEQFGLAVDSSDTQAGNGYAFANLAATAPYAGGAGTITNLGGANFAFNTASVTAPVQIAGVGSGTVSCDTGSVRYLGNIATTTKAGIYRTTIAYIAVPTF